jgi:hypothetical protein
MKPIGIENIAKTIVGWVFDFQNDNNRLPVSLRDLSDNKSDRHSYNPEKALQLNKRLGYETSYSLFDNESFKVNIQNKTETISFSSKSGKYFRGTCDSMVEEGTISELGKRN